MYLPADLLALCGGARLSVERRARLPCEGDLLHEERRLPLELGRFATQALLVVCEMLELDFEGGCLFLLLIEGRVGVCSRECMGCGK